MGDQFDVERLVVIAEIHIDNGQTIVKRYTWTRASSEWVFEFKQKMYQRKCDGRQKGDPPIPQDEVPVIPESADAYAYRIGKEIQQKCLGGVKIYKENSEGGEYTWIPPHRIREVKIREERYR